MKASAILVTEPPECRKREGETVTEGQAESASELFVSPTLKKLLGTFCADSALLYENLVRLLLYTFMIFYVP